MAAERPGVESGTRVLGSLRHQKSIFQFPIFRSWMQVSFVGLGGNGLALRFALGDRVVIPPSCVESHGVLGNSPRTALASVFGLLEVSFGSITVDLLSALRLEAEAIFTCVPDSDVVSTSTSSLPNWSPSY